MFIPEHVQENALKGICAENLQLGLVSFSSQNLEVLEVTYDDQKGKPLSDHVFENVFSFFL